MRTTIDGWIFRVNKLVPGIDILSQFSRPGNQFIRSVIFKPLEILLDINNRIKITAIKHIDDQFTKLRTIGHQSNGIKERWNIRQLHTLNSQTSGLRLPASTLCIFHLYQPARALDPD